MKLTSWYSMGVKPTREGVYKVMTIRDVVYWARWDGEKWCALSPDFEHAKKTARASMWAVTGVAVAWRGVAEDPNKKGAVAA